MPYINGSREDNMDINYLIESGILEKYAKHQLSCEQTAEIEELLQNNLELGEALEKIYIQLEGNGTEGEQSG